MWPRGRITGTAGPAMVAGALFVLGLVIMLSGLIGPVPSSGPRPGPTPSTTASETAPRTTPATPPPNRYHASPRPDRPAWARVPPTAVVIAALVLAVAVVGLALRLRRLPRRHTEPPPSPAAVPSRPPTVERAADEGLALLSGAGDVGDAVIACWVRLEEAATQTGRGRHPADTPTEFTAALLMAGIGEEAAVRELLGLYHLARFGSHPLPTGTADRAIACLEVIRASARARPAAR